MFQSSRENCREDEQEATRIHSLTQSVRDVNKSTTGQPGQFMGGGGRWEGVYVCACGCLSDSLPASQMENGPDPRPVMYTKQREQQGRSSQKAQDLRL